jgi:hypothetical protein
VPRPRKFTEAVADERRLERLRVLFPEYEPPTVAPPGNDREAVAEHKRRAEQARAQFDKRTEKERKHLLSLAADLIPALELPQPRNKELVSELGALLANVRWEWRSRRKIAPNPSLPVLGGVQPTYGEMNVTLKPGLKYAKKLRDWYCSLPTGLLMNVTIPLADESPALGVVIERLDETLASVADQYQGKPGHQPGERLVAQGAARWVVWFMDRQAPGARIANRRLFMFKCMHQLGIPCPNLPDDPGDFNAWFDEVEALARPVAIADAKAAPEDEGTTMNRRSIE